MATVWSGYTETGTYTKNRVRVDYSGTSATATLCYTRTNTYSGETGGSGTFTFAGVSTSFYKTFTGQQTDAAVASVSFTIPLTGGTYSGSASDYSGLLNWSGSVTIPSQGTAPTGLATSVTSRTWNSVTLQTSVSSWGSGSGSNRLVIHIGPTKNDETYLRQAEASYSPFTATINNSSTSGSHTAFTMKGGHTLYPYIYAYNGLVDARTWGDAFYLPPAPLQSITAGTQGYSGTNVTVPITITGGNSTNNNSVTVTTQYQYKVGSGSLSSWTSAGTGTPWTAKSVTLSVASNSSITVNARQVYQSQNSETKALTFKTKPLTPSLSNATTSFGSSGISVSITQNIGGWADVLTGHITITASDGTSKTTTTTFTSSPTTQTKTVQISGDWVRPATTYTITAYTSNTAGNSNTTTLTFRTKGTYVPYSGLSKSPIKVFVPVNRRSKEALKIYVGDANKKSKRVYMKG